jgi:hypothetical protein
MALSSRRKIGIPCDQKKDKEMNNITVLIAGDHRFRPYVANARRTTEALGYTTMVFDLGDLGFGEPFEGRVSDVPLHTIPCKPRLIRKALERVPANDYVIWLDADAIMQQRVDEICQDYDLGVTMREKFAQDPRVGAINAGIVFARNTPVMSKFLDLWTNRAEELDGDQSALNSLITLEKADRDQLVSRHDIRVQVFPCAVYNNFSFKDDMSQAKIIHYKSKHRARYPMP